MTAADGLTAESPAPATTTPMLDEATSLEADPGHASHVGPRTRGWQTLLLGGGGYLLLSVFIWWNVWRSHPTSTTTCGCGDASLFTWFFEWPAYAISHGLDPLFSTAMHYPGGVNLLANTSVFAFAVLLAPITWIFGPVASMNVALTLAPALSAFAMFVLLRRWTSWTPAAFVGGLLYGFSPLILVSLGDAHLMLGMAVVPPLMVACLDELLVRQRWSPLLTGIVLGLLATLQFFIGTEVLLIVTVMGAIGILLVLGYAALRRPDALRAHARYAMTGMAAGLGTAGVLLMIPVWYVLSGPAHLTGTVWPGLFGAATRKQTGVLKDYLIGVPPLTGLFGTAHNHQVGGYQGPILSFQYLGIGAVLVLLAGTIVWRRDRRLWLFGAIGLISVTFAIGARKHIWMPWSAFEHLPLIKNIESYRFVLIVYLAAAIMLGLIVDHTYQSVVGRRDDSRHPQHGQQRLRLWSRYPRWTAAAAGIAVAVAALFQPAAYLAQTIPMTTTAVVVPTWFRTAAPHLPPHQVLLIVPAPFKSFDNPMTWQALDDMRYSMVGEGGPGGILPRAGKERGGATVLAQASTPLGPDGTLTATDVLQVRRALAGWKVTMVVVPDQPDLPTYDQISSVSYVAALMTAATGSLPKYESEAWVWTGVRAPTRSPIPSDADLAACTSGVAARGVSAVHQATACVVGAADTGRPR